MILEKYTKQPSEVKDYDVGYSDWLPPGDTVFDVTTTVLCLTNATDVALLNTSIVVSPDGIKFWMAGGTDGAKYKLTALVSTQGGRIDEIELVFTIKDH